MKICMLIEAWKPIWAGGQVHVWELCKRLVTNYDCEIDLYVMNLKGKEKYSKVESHFDNKLKIIRVGKLSDFNFSSRIKWCFDVVKLVKKRKYDLIHAHANLPGYPAKKLSRKLKIPTIYTVHGSGLEAIRDMYGTGFKGKLLYSVEKYLQCKIKYTKQITVDSGFLKNKNVNKSIVIPNGVDIEKYDSISVDKSKKLKVIFVGRLHPQKGLRYLLKSISLIKDQLGNVEFHIVGGGEEERFLKKLSSDLGLNDFVNFRGKIYGDDLIKEYKSSHLFILPSLYEGQPLTLLEAWGAKLPVLVTDVGGNKDFVNEENGVLVNSKDVNGLSKELLKLVNKDRNALKQMGLSGYQMVKENYTWDKVAKKTWRVYDDVVRK